MKNKWFKKVMSVAMVSIMAVSLAACGSSDGGSADSDSGDGGSGEKTVITFSFDQGVGEPTQQIVDEFNESQDEVQVETIILPQDANTVHDDFVNKLASGDTSVDIMGLDTVYVGEFASAGWLADLSEYVPSDVTDTMIEGMVAGGTYDGKLVACPWFTNSSVLFYRTDVLEQLGAEVPTTWEGWMELADKAVGINGVEYGADFQASQSEAMVCNWVEYVWSNGGDVLDEDGNPIINSAENLEATEIMKKLVDEYAPEGVTTYSETESEQVFKEGKCLFIRDWSGFWSSGQGEDSKVDGLVGATKLPTGPSGTESHTCLGGLDLAVNNSISDEQKDACGKFIQYMISYDVQKEFTLIAAQPPVIKAVYEDEEVLEEIPFYETFYSIIEGGKSRPVSPVYSKLSDAIQRNIHQALAGEVEVSAALDALQAEAEELVK